MTPQDRYVLRPGATPERELASVSREIPSDFSTGSRLDLGAIVGLADEFGLSATERERLFEAVEAAYSAAKLLNRDIAEWIDQPQAAVVRRQLTILFCDLVGSTDMAERLDPEDLIAAISEYRGVCKAALDRWQGRLAKFLGDGILALFGWPVANEDDAERAVFAALEMVAAVNELNASDGTPLLARVGIATGVVVIGDVGVDGLYERDCVVGAAPNLAARVQAFATPGTVIIAPQTRALVGERFNLESQGKHRVKGITGFVEMWRVLGADRTKNRFEAKAGNLVPLFGRENEIARLTELWQCCARSEGKIVIISGEAGMGKSRLLQELRTRAEGAAHMAFQCLHYHANTALAPFIDKLHHDAGIAQGANEAERFEKIECMVHGWEIDNKSEAVRIVSALLSVPLAEGMEPLKLSPLKLRERTIELLIDHMEKASVKRPLMLIFEDVHWADPSTIELLKSLVKRFTSLPILLVMTAREPMQIEATESMPLTKLDNQAVGEMLRYLAKDSGIPQRTMESIAQSAQGVPLFLEELTGCIDVAWAENADGGGIPATLQDLLAARLDNLGDGREIVNVAATIGMAFSAECMALLVPLPLSVVESRLHKLCEDGILRTRTDPDGAEEFEFRHALVGETAYNAQLKTERRKLHKQIAETLEKHFPLVVERDPERLGRHYVRARESITGANYYYKAGLKALQSSAITEAIRNLTEGLSSITDLPPSLECSQIKLRLLATLGTAYMQAKGWAAPEVEEAYAAADGLSHAASDTSEAVWILWGTWVYQEVRGRIDKATATLARIRKVATVTNDDVPILVCDMMALQVHFYAGRFDDSIVSYEEFLNRYDTAKHRALTETYSTDLQLVSFIHHTLALFIAGKTDAAMAHVAKTEALLESHDHAHTISWGHTWSSVIHLLQGDTVKVGRNIAHGASIAQEQGFAYVISMARVFEGWIDAQNGEPARGEEKMALGIREFTSTGAAIAVPFFQTLRAEALTACGRHREALELLDQACDQIALWGEGWQAPEAYRVRGKALAAMNDPTALDAFEKAIGLAIAMNAPRWQLRAAHDYALYLIHKDDPTGASKVLKPLRPVMASMQPPPIHDAAWHLCERMID